MFHVLISNDDGIQATGLRALVDAFLADGWRVTVSAPDRERSAAAHSLTIKSPVVASPATLPGLGDLPNLELWKTDGTPVDCVKIALHQLCKPRPDLVVSGINNGWNAGTDVHYSGTVGAAMEAIFEGVPAIAVSTHHQEETHQRRAAELAVHFARRLMKTPLPEMTMLNINLPNCDPSAIRGVVEAPLARLYYTDAYNALSHTRGRAAYWLIGEVIEEKCAQGSDLHMLTEGYATVTALGWDVSVRGACGQILQE